MKVFFDGGCRPSGMETAVVIAGRSHIARDLGPGTSMDAEWLALIDALRRAHDLRLVDPLLLGDAAAVIAQAIGAVRCPASCAAHMAAFLSVPRPPGRLRIRYLRRTQNLAGIALTALHDADDPALRRPPDAAEADMRRRAVHRLRMARGGAVAAAVILRAQMRSAL